VPEGPEIEVKLKLPGKGEVRLSIKGQWVLEDPSEVKKYIEAVLLQVPREGGTELQEPTELESLTIKDRLLHIIKNNFKYGWFRSSDVKEEYERQFGEEIKASTVATYLARFYEEGILDRRGARLNREYRLIENAIKNM